MIAYAPGVQDIRGQLLGAGISALGRDVAAGLDLNKRLTGENKAMETLLPSYAQTVGIPADQIEQALQQLPTESPLQRHARLSSMLEGIVQVGSAKSQAANRALVQANTADVNQKMGMTAQEMQDSLAERGRMRALFGGQPSLNEMGSMIQQGANFQDLAPASTPPPTGAAALRAALGAGIENPRLLMAIGKYADEAPFTPSLVDLGQGVTGMMTSPKSAIPVVKPVPEKPSKDDQPEYSADGRFFRSSPSDAWKPVPNDPSVRPLTLNEWMMSNGLAGDGKLGKNYAEYRDRYETEQRAYKAAQAGTARPAAPVADPANGAAASQKFKKGDRARQNGVVYEFDGAQWNPVK